LENCRLLQERQPEIGGALSCQRMLAFLCVVAKSSESCICRLANYTVSQKKGATLTMAITLSILGVFAKFFHCCKEQ